MIITATGRLVVETRAPASVGWRAAVDEDMKTRILLRHSAMTQCALARGDIHIRESLRFRTLLYG